MYRYFQQFRGFEGGEYEFWEAFRTLNKSSQEYYVSIPLMYMDTSPTKDVLEYVPKLAELGEIYYITSCPLELERLTLKFFHNYDMPFKENLVFSADKATVIRSLGIDHFLDDLPHNVEAVQNLTDAYLFKAVHNRNDRERFRVINSMKEFYELLRSKHESKEN